MKLRSAGDFYVWYQNTAARSYERSRFMARCTAPVNGHRSSIAAANCPACSSRYGGYRSSYGYSGGYRSP